MGNTNSLDVKIDLHLTIRELQNEIKSLKEDNDSLRQTITKTIKSAEQRSIASEKVVSVVSQAAIDEFVEALLADPESNIAYVPDMIERPMEKKMLLVLIKAIGQLVDSASIKFMGHEIVMHLKPIEERPKLMESPRVKNLKTLLIA